MDDIRDAILDYQVSGDFTLFLQTWAEAAAIDGTATDYIRSKY